MQNINKLESYIKILADTYRLYQNWLCREDEISYSELHHMLMLVYQIEQAFLKMSCEDRCILFDEYFRNPNERRCSCKQWNTATNEVKIQVMSSFFRCLSA